MPETPAGLPPSPPILDQPGAISAQVCLQVYQPERIEIEVNTPRAGLLVLADTYHSGWRVWVDAQAERIYPVDLALRGVFLHPGQHRVVFCYDPLPFRLGYFITIAILSLIISPFLIRRVIA
jgi:uncharacterized membrane protein YfhO